MATIASEIKNLSGYPPNTECFVELWLPEDVQSIADEHYDTVLTDDEVSDVLAAMSHRFDANIGMSWEVISIHVAAVVDARENSDA